MSTWRFDRLGKRVARCLAAALLLIAAYFASAPFVVETMRLRAPASRANEFVYWYYLPALAYQGTDIPGSAVYESYFDDCTRLAVAYCESQ